MSLTKASAIMIRWFNTNFMQANPSKRQLILFGTSLQTGSIKVNDITIESRTIVKVLVTYLDSKLSFKEHVSNSCFENTRYCKQVEHGESFYSVILITVH